MSQLEILERLIDRAPMESECLEALRDIIADSARKAPNEVIIRIAKLLADIRREDYAATN